MPPHRLARSAATQWLDARPRTGVAECLAQTGWARTVGGSNPYLHIWARTGHTREEVDAAVARGEVMELPCARGCTYLVPAAHAGLALAVGRGFSDAAQLRTAKNKLGVSDNDIQRYCDDVMQALAGGPMTPAALKDALGDRVVNYGETGKKVGITTSLALALTPLRAQGRVRNIPTNGRLDNERYQYELWPDAPDAPDNADAEFARLYWEWNDAATLEEFRWFSGFGAGRAKQAIAGLELVEGEGGLQLGSRGEVDPGEPATRAVGHIDNQFHLRRTLSEHLTPAAAAHPVWESLPAGMLGNLPGQGWVREGMLIGVWDFDTERGEVVSVCFETAPAGFEAERARLQDYVHSQLGEVRCHSLDGLKNQQKRIAAMRSCGGH